MTKWLSIFLRAIVSMFRTRRNLAFENLLLSQQLTVLKNKGVRPQLTQADRFFWVFSSRIWSQWRDVLHIVRPETVVRWHRDGFRRYWALKSRKRGRPPISPNIRGLIRRMCDANSLWGAPRIHGELLKLGIDVSEAVVSKYMPRHRKPPSQTWRTFLENHATDILAIDFLTVPTATFRVLFVLVILSHDRRRIVHTNATEHPTAVWTAQQVLEAVGIDDTPRYLLRDNDSIYGNMFRQKVAALGLAEVTAAPRSPWQNPYVERVIGSIRRECLNHTIIVSERHLRRVVADYVRYYNRARTHLSLAKDSPDPRHIHALRRGRIVRRRHCGGLHHEYRRKAA
jgi:putative transposase